MARSRAKRGPRTTTGDGGKKVRKGPIKELSPTAYTFKMETQGPDGKWAPMMESKNTKAK